eukprot:3170525-Prymnesium_polylepis.1
MADEKLRTMERAEAEARRELEAIMKELGIKKTENMQLGQMVRQLTLAEQARGRRLLTLRP